jgi:chemotaxis protein MotB
MKLWVVLYAIMFLLLGLFDELQAVSSDVSPPADSAQVASPDTPTRVLNEMKGPPAVMQQELLQLLKPEVDRGDITIHSTKDRLHINLASKALFDSGSDQVHPQGVDILMRIGSVLRSAPNWETTVTGHADNQPIKPRLQVRFLNNTKLSEARAQNGSRILMEAGMDPNLIKTAGKGEVEPIATNATAEGRSKNRRIEIVVAPSPTVEPSVVAVQ